jgi:hypothetical protein
MGASIRQLNQRHFRILDLAVRGRTNAEIARELQMSEGQVSTVINSPNFQHEFALRRERVTRQADEEMIDAEDEVDKVLREGAIKAARKLIDAVDTGEMPIAVKASSDILDRTGHPKVQVQKGSGSQQTVVISGGDIGRLTESLEMANGRIAASA